MIMTCDTDAGHYGTVEERRSTFMSAAGMGAAGRRVIIVGVDDSAEAGAAAHWAVREAALRKDDVLLVHAYEVPLLPAGGRAAAIAQGRPEREALLDKAAATLPVPSAMHLDQLIEIDTAESLLPRLSEQADVFRQLACVEYHAALPQQPNLAGHCGCCARMVPSDHRNFDVRRTTGS
jgi:nucleotide-binding universal stress UspA family protein